MQYSQKIRNPIVVLLLSFVTCGIYSWFVVYQLCNEIREFNGDQNINPALEIILCIVTCGLYPIYWCYKYSKMILDMQQRTGVAMPNDISIIALILSIFGLFMISLMLMQTEINKVWEKVSE